MVKKLPANAGDAGSIPGPGRSPREGNGIPTPVCLPGKSHGHRSLAGYLPWGRKESDTTERLTTVSTVWYRELDSILSNSLCGKRILKRFFLR